MESAGYEESGGCRQTVLSNSQTTQTISFGASEERWSSVVVGSEVQVEVGATNHTSGSSAITTRNISNYSWDHHYLSGSLVAQHSSGNYVAYAIRAPQKTSGMVRIINNKSGDRGLVRNIRGMVRDLAFAHITNRIILAFTDQFGTLYVCEVTDTSSGTSLNTEILVEVASNSNEASDHHRVIWCPYIPDEQAGGEEGDEPAHLLVLTHGPCAEIWNISLVLREHGGGQLRREQVASGYQLMEQHSAPITDAAFSPDGTALATAALDGYVKFFQVYMADEEKSPRCLHQWNPHDGKPLSALFFLDDHKHHSPDVQFWKYAVTGACNNSELRVWSCESWQCHQTLRFVPALQDPPQTPLIFKATMDPSANFLLLSDIQRRMMYVVVVYQDENSGGGGGGGGGGNSISGGIGGGNCCVGKSSGGGRVGGSAQLVSVSELPVQYPALFLSITDAAWKPYKLWKHDHMHDAAQNAHDEEDMESLDMVDGVVLRCVLINTVSLQEATLRFKPDIPLNGPPTHHHDLSVSRDSIEVRDGLTDLSLSTSEVDTNVSREREDREEEQPPPPPPPPDALTSPQSSSLSSQHNTPASTQPPMNLLTPDSFSSPRRPEDSDLPEEDNEEGSVSSKVTPNKFDVPYAPDFENAALSLLLRCGSGTLMPSSDSESSSSLKILGSVVAGSSTTPPATALPPPSTTPHPVPLQDHEVPIATAEVVVPSSGGVGRTGASTTSSPSLEVQQILHSQNGKSEEFADEDDEDPRARDEAGMAEDEEDGDDDDDDDDEEEEEEGEEEEDEPEAHRQPPSSHSHPPPPPPPDHQALPQPPSSSIVKPPTSLPQPPASVMVKPKPPTSLPQPPTQPPSSLPQPPLSLPEQSPPLVSKTPTSGQQSSPSSLPRPPASSLPQVPPSSLPQSLPSSLPQPASSVPQPLNTLAQLTQKQASLHTHDVELPKAPSQPIDLFASVRGLPTQLTCAQLEAEIKAGTVSPEASTSPAAMTHQSNSAQMKNERGFNSVGHPSESPAADQLNGPVTPTVTADDVAQLRTLMMGCVSISREQGQVAVSQVRSLSSKMDKTLHHLTQLTKQVEEVKSAQSQIQMELPRALAAALRPVVEGTLRNELRTVVLPGVVKSLEPLSSHLTQEVHSLTKNSEGQVLDSLTKVIHSRSFIDGIVGSVGTAVATTVQSSCRDAYNKLLLPGLNALTQQIFAQVNENFSRGTREYLQNLENEVQGGRTAVQENMGKVSQSLTSACNSLSSHSKSLQDNVNKLVAQQNTLSDTLTERLRGLVREEVTHILQEHQANLDACSRAHTPAPTPHAHNPKVAQQQMQGLISQGQFNTAFKQALSASDLSLVMFVCERVNPQQVFNMTPCPLSQDVLLSLVNQLSYDLTVFTDLKLKYLEEAIMNLDSSHPVTREHMRSVLQGFQRNMNMYLMTHPNNKKVKMLLMAVNHLVTS